MGDKEFRLCCKCKLLTFILRDEKQTISSPIRVKNIIHENDLNRKNTNILLRISGTAPSCRTLLPHAQ